MANPNSLQTFYQVLVLFGLIISAIGGYGSYYYGKVVENEKEITIKKEKEIEEKEYFKKLTNNLKLEIELNLDLIKSHREKDLLSYIKKDIFPLGKYSYNALKESLKLSLDIETKKVITVCISNMEQANDLIDRTIPIKSGDKIKEINIKGIVSSDDYIFIQLKWLSDKIK